VAERAAGTSRRPQSTSGLWALALVFLISLPLVTTRINASDEIQFFSWLHSWTFDGDADFDNEYRYFYDAGPGRNPGFVATFLDATNEAGRRPNFAPIGSAVLWLPFYAAGHIVAVVSGAPTDGFSYPYVAAVAYGSALYGFLALLLSASIVRHLLGRSGLPAAVVVWLGTPLIFYMYVAPGFAHACSAFAVALFIRVWLLVRDRWSLPGVVALGLCAALLAMVREQDAFFALGPAIDFARWSWRHLRAGGPGPARVSRIATQALAGVVAFVLAYTPQLVAYQALNGAWRPDDKVARKMTWTSPHFFEVLLSPEHGLFLWTPLALVAIGGLIWLAISGRPTTSGEPGRTRHLDGAWIASLMLLMVALQVYVSGSVESWTVAGAFGQRRFVALTPLLAVGLAALAPPPGALWPRRTAVSALAVALIWWNIGLMAQFGLHLMDRQRLSIAHNARVSFVDLPRMAPAIAVRYLTDRESFYGLPREPDAAP
jgi:hypothetical protein